MTRSSIQSADRRRPDHATVFIWLLAISSIWHYTSSSTDIVRYWLQYDPVVTPTVFLSIATAFVAALFPTKTWALLTLSAGQLVAISVRFPHVADHMVMQLALHLSVFATFFYSAFRKRNFAVNTAEMFELFSPVGRWLLIVMYFFGTFHKINPGFMGLEASCAIPFIKGLPLPDVVLDNSLTQWSAIYGTLIFEFIAMLLLLSARTKYAGMLLGMSFHFLIGISAHGTLAHFSAFAMALHTLFLPSSIGDRLGAEAMIPQTLKRPESFKIFTIVIVLLQVSFALHLGFTRQGYLVNSLFIAFGTTLMYLVWRHGQIRAEDAPYRLRSSFAALNVVPVWFVFQCMSPYIGLGTGGTIQMFSGLRTEGGISNHYIIREPIYLFPYQDKVIYVEEAQNASLNVAKNDGQGIVLFDFQRHFSHKESIILPAQLRIDGHSYRLVDPESMRRFADEHFTDQSWLERKYLSFRLVDEPHPNRCRH